MEQQKTISKEVAVKGVGLHSGKNVSMALKPAQADAGIAFIRVDLPGKPLIKVCADSLQERSGSLRCSRVGTDAAYVQTIEHLLAALSGLGIDNLLIEIDGDEVPGMDGSSKDLCSLLDSAGIKELGKAKTYFVVKEPIAINNGSVSLTALPYDGFKVSYTLNYEHPLLRSSFFEMDVNGQSFKQEAASARTFCLEEEVAKLRAAGFGQGANYQNTLVLGKDGVIGNALRFKDEFVRHKVLDLIGDLYILGRPVKGHIIALRSGHSMNIQLVKKILQQNKGGTVLDVNDIMKILPHREPFLFVDRITELEPGKRIVGIKNVTMNEYFFRGHFPGKPVMPGVIIIEAMAQVGGVMMLSQQENKGKIAFFLTINNVKFRKTVVPGDQLVFEVTAGKIKTKTGQIFGKALVDGKVVAEAELMFAIDQSQPVS
jgi:UDP-3-O-[3-hydroxymyristoyl] N-acetylglucosamine deacetylase / 3-hydroxyacyl-[acyl-carrier-protein] dehydratase